jgi:2-polyprenyl-6-methoxyphenol hydroxylase-like FAD-dependent oxidoreductase
MEVLIAGAGVAGPALALLLTKAGHKCTIVERASEFRASGQQIDVSGEALKVIRRMGVDEDFKARRVEDEGLKFVDANDNTIASFPAGATDLVKELEIMRAEVVRVFAENTKDVEYILGEYITEIQQEDSRVTVTFVTSGQKRSFDIVVAADGLRSRTRDAAFDPSNTRLLSLGMYVCFLSLPWQESDGHWSRWHTIPKGRNITIRPNAKNGTSSAYVVQVTERSAELAEGSFEDQKQRILEIFKDAGWESERVLDEIKRTGADFYGQEIAQAKSKFLISGRVVLLGDAGYCPTPLTGQGTSLALIGAYILAGCIATYSDVDEALAQYEKQVRPFVDHAQKLPPGVPWIANPQSEIGVRVLNNAVWIVGGAVKLGVTSALAKLGALVPSFGSKGPILPDYPALGSAGAYQ